MQVGIMEVRPPYVAFEYRPVEDREQTIAQGRPIYRDEAFAIITPAGSKDRIPKPAKEWLQSIKVLARQDNYPVLWVDHYSKLFEYWEKGEDIPETGTTIKNWPVATPAEVKALLEQSVRTVEDVAIMNEETMSRLGMGGRKLKERAIAYLQAATNPSAHSAEVIALRAENTQLKSSVEKLTESVALMTQKLDNALSTPAPQNTLAFASAFNRPETSSKDIGDILGGNDLEE